MPRKIILVLDMDGTATTRRLDRHPLATAISLVPSVAKKPALVIRANLFRYVDELNQLKNIYGDDVEIEYKIVTARPEPVEFLLNHVNAGTESIKSELENHGVTITMENTIRAAHGLKGKPLFDMAIANPEATIILLEDQLKQTDDVNGYAQGVDKLDNLFAFDLNDEGQFINFSHVVNHGTLATQMDQETIEDTLEKCFNHIRHQIKAVQNSDNKPDFKLYTKARKTMRVCLEKFTCDDPRMQEGHKDYKKAVEQLRKSIDNIASACEIKGIKRGNFGRGFSRTVTPGRQPASPSGKANTEFEKNILKLCKQLYARLPSGEANNQLTHERAAFSEILDAEERAFAWEVNGEQYSTPHRDTSSGSDEDSPSMTSSAPLPRSPSSPRT